MNNQELTAKDARDIARTSCENSIARGNNYAQSRFLNDLSAIVRSAENGRLWVSIHCGTESEENQNGVIRFWTARGFSVRFENNAFIISWEPGSSESGN